MKLGFAAALAAFSIVAQGQELVMTPALTASARALTGDIYANGQSYELLAELTDDLGPRLSGSANYERSVRWAVDKFHAMGIRDVRLQPVELRHGWQRGSALAVLLGESPRVLHVAAYGWSPPTPKGGLRARVAPLTDTTDAAIAAANVGGAIVLVDRQAITGPAAFHLEGAEAFARERRSETLDRRLRDAGARALLVYSTTLNQVLRTSDPGEHGEALAVPYGTLGREDALLLLRQSTKGAVEIELHLDTIIGGAITVNSVIAEIPGRERADEVVMIGAHLDSWDLGTGAQDNGSGAAEVLDAARALAALPLAPRRTLRFALWASEEQGLNGSNAYVRAHGAEMKQFVAYLNSDTGSGRPLGWNVVGREDVAGALRRLGPMFARIGGSATTKEIEFDTDTCAFFIAGVPVLDLNVVDDDYDSVVHHKPGDTFDKVDAHNLAAGTAMLTVAAYAFAEAEQRPAKRLSWSEVQALLRDDGALDYVLTSELKDLWHE